MSSMSKFLYATLNVQENIFLFVFLTNKQHLCKLLCEYLTKCVSVRRAGEASAPKI